MLSTTATLGTAWRSTSVRSSSKKRSADFDRKAIVEPLSPQNVQWCFAPHQQPLADSTGRWTSRPSSATRRVAPSVSKYPAEGGVGTSSISPAGGGGGVDRSGPRNR